MADIVGQIALELGVDTTAFTKQLRSLGKTTNSATSSIVGSFGKIGGAVAGALSIGAIVKFSKACIDLGSDLAEVQNVVDVTFGSMSGAVNDWAKNAMTSYGMSEKVAKEYMGQFGAMSKAFGNTEAMAYDQAAALTGLAGDVASFYNMTTDEAFTKLKAVYTGETEALKSLGVVMTQTALDEYALQKGIGKTTKNMSEQEKVALRLSFVTDRLSGAAGDFARTADGWANQTRVLSLRFDALKATIGQGLINALTPAIQLLNELLAKLQVFADAFYNLTVKIFGDAGGAGSAAAAASEALATNTANAANAAKAYKKQLAGFDNLNVISTSSTDGSSGGGGSTITSPTSTAAPTTGSSAPGYDTSAIEGKLVEIATIAGAASLALGAVLTFTGANIPLGIGLLVLGAAGLTAGLSAPGYDTSAIENTLIEIAAVVGAASLALGAVLTFTGANIPLGIGLLAIGAAGLAAAVALDTSVANQQVATGIDLITATVSAAALAIGAVLCFSGVNIPLGIALLAVGAAGLVATTALNWESTANEVKTLIMGITAAAGAALLALGIILLWAGMSAPLGIALIAAGAASLVSAGVLNWGSTEKSVSDTIIGISGIVGGALLGLGAVLAFSGLFVGLGIALMAGGAVALASSVMAKWDSVPEKTKHTISLVSAIAGAALLALGVILLFTGAGIPLGLGLIAAGGAALAAPIAANWGGIVSTLKGVFDKIADIATAAFKGIGNFFIGILNGIIDGLNFAVGMINQIPGVNIPKIGKIPKLAKGGYVAANTPQLAIIGDNKHEGEIVAPESKIAEAVAAGFAMVMSKMQTSNAGNDRPLYATIKLGENTFWEGFVDYHNSEVMRTGESPLLV